VPRDTIHEASQDEQRALFGPLDRHLRGVRERFGVRIVARRGSLVLEGDDDRSVREVGRRVRRVLDRLRAAGSLPEEEVQAILLDGPGGDAPARAAPRLPARRSAPGAPPFPRPPEPPPTLAPAPATPNQARYVGAIRSRDVVFSIGPAGTGKTFLAVAEAVSSLRSGDTRKLILTRPAVEAGEKLGFLPGDFQAKINPYLRPLYDALGELLPYGEVKRYLDSDVIEIVPLAYMRGRTLKHAFIILDEGQNTTPSQMKMFLTRLGNGSKIVVNGDVTQVDLPENTASGLVDAIRVLEGVPGIEVIRFGAGDIMRHPMVQRIVDAYARRDEGIDLGGRPRARPAVPEPGPAVPEADAGPAGEAP
jgi:phosphate starvation-inducible PhoH-like protein